MAVEQGSWATDAHFQSWFHREGGLLWEQLPNLVESAIAAAPQIDLGRNNDFQEPINSGFDRWNHISSNLEPSVFVGNLFLPEIPQEEEYLVNNNHVFSRTPEGFYLLVYHTYYHSSFHTSGDPAQVVQDATDHELIHHDTYARNGINGLFFMSYYRIAHSPDTFGTQANFSPYSGFLPIEEYVYNLLAPRDPSDGDLAGVGLTPQMYTELLRRGIDPIAHILTPWFEAGIIQRPDTGSI